MSDLGELNLPKTCQTDFPDPDDILTFKLIISPDEVRKTVFCQRENGSKVKCFVQDLYKPGVNQWEC